MPFHHMSLARMVRQKENLSRTANRAFYCQVSTTTRARLVTSSCLSSSDAKRQHPLKSPKRSSTLSRRLASTWHFPPAASPPSIEELHQNGLPFLSAARQHAEEGRMFLSSKWPDSDHGELISYEIILQRSSQVASFLLELGEPRSSSHSFVANLTVPGSDYVTSMWGAWAAGYASVPLALSYKTPELEHVLVDTQPERILVGNGAPNLNNLMQAAENVGMSDRITFLEEVLTYDNMQTETLLGANGIVKDIDRPALVVYTSGTTGKAKGVLSTHRNLFHQVTDLVSSWKWHPTDTALHVLPLHHVHGITKLCSAAYVGARLDFQPFDATRLWNEWAESPPDNGKPNVFMAVPTIYAKLLEAAESLPPELIENAVENTLHPMRLMVSGSAALPVSSFERWRELTGQTLLERYGMTEFGMSISNPYEPVEERHPGHVGLPLPSVEARLIDEESGAVIDTPNTSGSLRIKGPTVFQEYLNRPDAMEESFDEDGYFITGDVAEFNAELRSYRILGRASVDILKVGGYKLSALEIERDLLEHPDIAELAILGVPDETWVERVGMIYRMKTGSEELTIDSLRTWCKDRMAKYKIPTRLLLVTEIPKNAMGKVNKKTLVKLFETESD